MIDANEEEYLIVLRERNEWKFGRKRRQNNKMGKRLMSTSNEHAAEEQQGRHIKQLLLKTYVEMLQ